MNSRRARLLTAHGDALRPLEALRERVDGLLHGAQHGAGGGRARCGERPGGPGLREVTPHQRAQLVSGLRRLAAERAPRLQLVAGEPAAGLRDLGQDPRIALQEPLGNLGLRHCVLLHTSPALSPPQRAKTCAGARQGGPVKAAGFRQCAGTPPADRIVPATHGGITGVTGDHGGRNRLLRGRSRCRSAGAPVPPAAARSPGPYGIAGGGPDDRVLFRGSRLPGRRLRRRAGGRRLLLAAGAGRSGRTRLLRRRPRRRSGRLRRGAGLRVGVAVRRRLLVHRPGRLGPGAPQRSHRHPAGRCCTSPSWRGRS